MSHISPHIGLQTRLAAELPSLATASGVAALQEKGLELGLLAYTGIRSLKPYSDKVRMVNRAIVATAVQYGHEDISEQDIVNASVVSAEAAVGLIVDAPDRMELSPRNPKPELPQLGRLLFASVVGQEPLKVVVPVCPDTNEYRLGSGIGEVAPKGIRYASLLHDYLKSSGIAATVRIDVADVEGLDPVILKNSGETTESHFAKTRETRLKTEDHVAQYSYDEYMHAASMHEMFEAEGKDFLDLRAQAVLAIEGSDNKKVRKIVEDLMAERIRLGNFDRFADQNRRDLVVTELASYAAYGTLIGGRAVILSPDAKSAVPAYHFLPAVAGQQPSPVVYAP